MTTSRGVVFALMSFVSLAYAGPSVLPSGAQTSAVALTVVSAKIPAAWFNGAKGYEKAVELQRQTGADVFLYFSRDAPPDEKGLCHWFDAKELNDGTVRKYLRDYIRVQVPLPANPESQELAKSFQVKKCPAVFIIQPGGHREHCKVFDWSTGRPKLIPPEDLIKEFQVRSSERYSTTGGKTTVLP
jgi:hypothetical protein